VNGMWHFGGVRRDEWSEPRTRSGRRPVSAVMSRRVVTVSPETRVRVAEWVLIRSGTRYLPVLDEERLVGLVCEGDLARASLEEVVASCMSQRVVSIDARASLAEAAEMMNQHVVGCLPVVVGEALVGIVTRADLRRAGLPEDTFTEPVCASCGGHEQVRPDPRTGAVAFCVDCLERATDEVEIGGSG
jgi:acetoin utilization protein AcuB